VTSRKTNAEEGPVAAAVSVPRDAGEAGTLYLVPTPIGNPGDITMRAVDVLRQVEIVAAEDTRHARSLLRPLGVTPRLVSYHDHNEETRSRQLLDALHGGQDVALVSDAGTPLLNDPGYRVVTAAIAAGVRVCPLPGSSAAITALLGSGIPMNRFHYVGFLPRKAPARRTALAELARIDAALIFFEAPHRLLAALHDMAGVLGDRPAALACNLTKENESYLRGSLASILAELSAREAIRGQYTMIVGGAPQAEEPGAQALAGRLATSLLRHGAGVRLAREVVQEVTGLPRNWVYEHVQHEKQAHP
jgi:16S rRNA (cytidine1402-2'-O)-methyltransferase